MLQPHRFRTLRLGSESVIEVHDDQHCSDHSTRQTARHLDIGVGTVVVEAGCGTGVLSLLAAQRGAARVHATDLDPKAIALLRAAASANRLDDRIVASESSLLDGIQPTETPDMIVAVLPQKPYPTNFSLRFAGGVQGTDLLLELIKAAAERLRPGGRLTLYHHSLAAPSVVEQALLRAFRFRVVGERFRVIRVDAYDQLAPGMLDHLMDLADRGIAHVWREGQFLLWRSRILQALRR